MVVIDIGPILPRYINKINNTLEASDKPGVIPVVNPVVANALVFSNFTLTV